MSVETQKELGIDLSVPDTQNASTPAQEDVVYNPLATLTKPQKVRIALAGIGVIIVMVTWLAVSNTGGTHTPGQLMASLFGLKDANVTGDVYQDPPPCPTVPPKSDCPTETPCRCEGPPKRECPPTIRQCRGCPGPGDLGSCSVAKCKCSYEKYTPPQDPNEEDSKLKVQDYTSLDLLRRSKPGTRQRLLMINDLLRVVEPWFDVMSPRTTNTGIRHTGQGGNVAQPCQVCRERNEWMRCVYGHRLTGYAWPGISENDKKLRLIDNAFIKDYVIRSHNTGYLGFANDYFIQPNNMPQDKYFELEVHHYNKARFLHKALSFKYEDVDGASGVCSICPELKDDETIKEHIRCIWLRGVGILDLLTPNHFD